MAANHKSNEDHLWEIERIALAYEVALKQPDCVDSIESLVAANLRLPRIPLLKALIETELDVLGTHEDSFDHYSNRFPEDVPLVRRIFETPLDKDRPPLMEGECVGAFRIERLLGKGAVGYVYKAFDTNRKSQVAIKILRPDRLHARAGSYCDLFRNEAKIGGTLDHPRIVKLLGSGEHAGLPYHVFDFVDGVTLREFCRRRPLPPLVAARIIADVADAIDYSHHRGIVHRDLKPSNIIVDQAGLPYITDFGIALRDSQQGSGARIAGTPQYMSPEQLKGDSDLVDGRSDIYSMGVVLYEALTGVHPTLGHASSDRDLDEALIIKSATPLRQRIKVSSTLERICMKTLEKEPGNRFSTAGDLSRALRKFILVNRVKQALPLMSLSAILLACTLFALQSMDVFQYPQPAAGVINPALTHAALPDITEKPTEAKVADLPPQTLESLLAKGTTNLSTDDAQLAAKLIIAELRVNPNEHHPYWQYFASSDDNTLQTALVHSCAAESLDAMSLIARINSETIISIRSAMLHALGEYSLEQIPQSKREQLLPALLSTFCTDPSASIHSSVEWLLRRWSFESELKATQRRIFRTQPDDDFQWYTAIPDITMIVCDLPSGSVAPETGKFAISAHEISTGQWEWNNSTLNSMPSETESALPKNFVSWHTCAAFCNRLSERVGLPPSQYCYEQLSGDRYRPFADAVLRRGFRMPTLAEWTYAARAKTSTGRYWGRRAEMLENYANCRPHSLLERIPSGTLKPNGFGLFDALGNVSEWIHDTPNLAEPISVAADRPIRGGSAWTTPEKVQADSEFFWKSTDRGERMGLRLAQSLLPIEPTTDVFKLKLRAENQLELPGKLTTLSQWIQIIPASDSLQAQSSASSTFVGKVWRSEAIRHTLQIENCTFESLDIQQFAITGCVEAVAATEGNRLLLPGDSLSIPLRFKQQSIGTQKGNVAIYWTGKGGRSQKSEYDLIAYITGAAVAAIEDPLDDAGSIHIDFGSVAAGTKLRQITTLLNVGDQELTLSEARSAGAIEILSSPSAKEVIGNNYAFYEFQIDTKQNGSHSGTMEISTGDPLMPTVKVTAQVSVEDLSSIPVVGLFREGNWLLDYNHDGTPDRSVKFGEKTDQPLAGDFDGDGVADLALVRRNQAGEFELHIRFQSGIGERIDVRQFNVSTGQIVVGDCNGDGKCDVVWVSHSSGTDLLSWQIDTNGDSRWDEVVFYGFPADIPMLGDWNGDGKADVGTLRRSPGINAWFLNGIGLQNSFREIHYGLPHDIPVIADWNGDGRTDIGVYRTSQGIGSFLLDLDFDPASERFIHLGQPSDVPISFMSSLPSQQSRP